jgi:hypothetical protein
MSLVFGLGAVHVNAEKNSVRSNKARNNPSRGDGMPRELVIKCSFPEMPLAIEFQIRIHRKDPAEYQS